MSTGGTASGRPRLVDVAARAGVSTATASLVLRGRPGPSAGHGGCRARGGRRPRLPARPHREPARPPPHPPARRAARRDQPVPRRAGAGPRRRASGDRGLDLVLGTTTPPHRRAPRPPRPCSTSGARRCVLLGPQMPDADLTALASSVPGGVVGRAGTAGVTGVLAADDQGLEAGRRPPRGVWGTQRIAFVDGPRGSIARPAARATATAMARHGLGDRVDVVRGGADRGRGALAAARGCCARPPATGPRQSSPSTTGSRSACATPCCARGCGCRRTSRWSATTTARWPGSARRPHLGEPGPEALAERPSRWSRPCSRAAPGAAGAPTSSSRHGWSSARRRPAPRSRVENTPRGAHVPDGVFSTLDRLGCP